MIARRLRHVSIRHTFVVRCVSDAYCVFHNAGERPREQGVVRFRRREGYLSWERLYDIVATSPVTRTHRAGRAHY